MTQRIAIESVGTTGAFGTGMDAFKVALERGFTDFELYPVDPDNDARHPASGASSRKSRPPTATRRVFSRIAPLHAPFAASYGKCSAS